MEGMPLREESTVAVTGGFVDLVRETVVRDGVKQRLSARESRLVAYLSRRPNQVVDRAELLRAVWEYRSTRPSRAVDLTMMRLRRKIEPDPSQPIHLLAVHGEGYKFVPPGPEPVVRTRVEPEAARLYGRDADLDRVARALERGRLVTLVGPGGVGKTTVARRFAHDAVVCELAEAGTAAGVVGLLARSLGVTLEGDPDGHAGRIGHALAARGACRVVLDNLEQVVAVAAPLVARWMALAPAARFLVTSRERLRVAGEQVVDLEPLSSESAAELLVDRVRAAGRTADAADPAVLELVRRLDGLPLAIELAASRARVLSLPELLRRLDLRLLAAADRDREHRHASLDATLRWSWDLLEAPEQRLLAWLSVFRGGFDLEAVEEIGDDEVWPLDLLESLLDKSLVAPAGPDRWRLLETVRAFAADRLAERGEVEAAVHAHATCYAAFGERCLQGTFGPAAVERREDLAREQANLLAAQERSRDPGLRARLGLPLAAVLRELGPVALELQVLDRALEGAAPPLRARLLADRAELRYRAGSPPSACLEDIEAALTACPREEAPVAHAWALLRRTWLHAASTGRPPDPASLREAISLGEADPALHCSAHQVLTMALGAGGDLEGAQAAQRAGIAVARGAGDRRWEAMCRGRIAEIARRSGQVDGALREIGRAIDDLRALGDVKTVAILLVQEQGRLLEHRGDLRAAAESLAASVPLYLRLGNVGTARWVESERARICAVAGEWDSYEEADASARRLADQPHVPRFGQVIPAMLAQVRAWRAWEEGDLERAEQVARGALAACRRDGSDVAVARLTLDLALLAVERGADASAHLDDLEALSVRIGDGHLGTIARLLRGADVADLHPWLSDPEPLDWRDGRGDCAPAPETILLPADHVRLARIRSRRPPP